MLKIKYINTDYLNPYKNNSRTHSEAQIKQISASIQEFGFTNPILIDGKGIIIAGHGRVMAAKALGLDEVPTILLDSLSEAQRAAYVIADNKLALNAGWDDQILTIEISALKELDFDIDLLGFDENELKEILNDLDVEDKPVTKDLNNIPKDFIHDAWKEWALDVYLQHQILLKENYSFSGISEAQAKIYFLKANYCNMEYPRFCSLAFHPNQFSTNGDTHSVLDGLLKISEGDIKTERLRFFADEKPNVNHMYSGSLPFAGSRMPLDFPANLAKKLINEYGNKGRILDPCHGWGGRLVGFLMSDATHYTGVDVSPLQHKGVNRINECFSKLIKNKKQVNLIVDEYENSDIGDIKFDFAITSPPYFDVEKYDGGNQSHEEYDNYSEWMNGFYTNLIEKTYNSLKTGGYFALQVGSQRYPLLEDGKKIAIKTGFSVDRVTETSMKNNFKNTEEEKSEVFLILTKCKKL